MFIVQVDFGDELPELGDLHEASDEVRYRLSTRVGGNTADALQWLLLKQGWSGVLMGATNVDAGLEWFELFIARWGDAFDGRIIGGPRSTMQPENDPHPQLTAYVAYTTGDLAAINRNDRDPLWYVDNKTTLHLTEQGHEWAYTRGCRQYFDRDGETCQPVGYDGVGLAVAQGLDPYVSVELECVHSNPFRSRKVGWWPHGNVAYQVTDPTQSWDQRLDTVRGALSWLPRRTDVGMIRHGVSGVTNWMNPHTPWPHIREPDVRYNRPLLASYVPDVSGIQLLTDDHLGKATSLTDWTITALGGGRHLVESRNLAAWYSDPDPDPDLLAQARADFGDMILTEAVIAANSPWHEG